MLRTEGLRHSFRSKTLDTRIDREGIRLAYDDVRADDSGKNWAVFKFDGNEINCKAIGDDFSEFRSYFDDEERAFGFIRVQSGDEMSKRTKFLFITWLGPKVSAMKRARMVSDKALIKEVIKNFAVELQVESPDDLNMDHFREAIMKAGGANYGTGIRDL